MLKQLLQFHGEVLYPRILQSTPWVEVLHGIIKDTEQPVIGKEFGIYVHELLGSLFDSRLPFPAFKEALRKQSK